jgi:cytochrome c
MRSIRAIIGGCTAIATLMFLLAFIHPFGNAGIHAQQVNHQPLMSSAPPEVRDLLSAKCADCHSMQTRTPVYGRFAPASWLMERDIIQARNAMNLSRWEQYTPEEQETLKTKMLLETRAHKMPPPQYLAMHWDAQITSTDLVKLTSWARTSALSDSNPTADPAGEGDAARGKTVFEKRCTGCHAMEQDREGPRLHGVFGRTSGTVARFDYSPALKNAHIVWNEKTLERWLTDPDSLVPGNNMEFHVAKPEERRDVIRYLQAESMGK